MTETNSRKDFFISYTSADRPWAEWIAWQLEQEGYTTLIQAWDFAPGSNFVLEMDTAARTAERTIAVLSPEYVQSGFTPSEWVAAFAHDPKGEQRLLVPVRIRPFNAEGLLRQVVYIDLVGRDEQEARTVLLAGVRHERAKPASSPAFPAIAQTQAEQPAFPSALPSLWNIPYRRNPYFTGREELLTRLHELLHSGTAAALTQPQAISGLGGIGKTQTAVEYAYRSRGDYQAVLWAAAASRETLISDFVALAALLQLPERDVADQGLVVAAVKRWLESTKGWLLILDNADDLELVADFMPLASSGHILLTTRAQFTGAIANSLEVEKMEQPEGALLLLRRAKKLAAGAPLEQATAPDRSLAEAVVRELDGLPLALDQAGAYIEETYCGLSGYLDLYRTRRKELLQRRSKLRSEHPEPVGTTWSLSFQKVEQANPAAAELLRLCAFLDPDAIPEDIITAGAAEAGPLLKPIAADPFQLNEAIEVLRTYSLLRHNAETKTLNMHRLMQVVLRDSMDNKTQKLWATQAVRAVNATFPEVESTTWEFDQRYLPQVQVCAALIKQYSLVNSEALDLLDRAGQYLYNQAQYSQANSLLQLALAMREQLQDPERIELFVSYSRKDEKFLYELSKNLSMLKRQGFIDAWHAYDISADANSSNIIKQYLNFSQIILFLVSSDFLASDYCYSEEVRRALIRHERGELRAFPIILRPAVWVDTPLGHLQVLPRDARPVTTWQNKNEAWISIMESLRLICQESRKKSSRIESIQHGELKSYELFEVFVKSGVPSVTFVAREDFERLKLSLAQPGRGVVIEGPSGVGKTTALKKAIEELRLNAETRTRSSGSSTSVRMLSARKPEDQIESQTLLIWHEGTVIIDDFHRLDPDLRRKLVDYLKYLADTEPVSKKLVIVGIPQTGQTLVDTSFDVATRIDVFKLGQVRDALILSMIEKGEKALNIEFDQKTEIVLAANGSLNVAQFLCFNICHRGQVVETQNQLRVVPCDIEAAVSSVMIDLARKFGESIRRFAALGGSRDSTCLKLLEALTYSDDGFLSLPILKNVKSDLAPGIERFISNRWMDTLYQEYPTCANHLFFDQAAHALVIDDPQLTFYLKKLKFSLLGREVGKVAVSTQGKVFISYSHKDAKWLDRLQVHLKPLERKGVIDLWADIKIATGARWREEIQSAIESSTVAVILVSADFLASDFISEYELPQILSRAESGGTSILPVIVAPCLFDGSGLDVFQTINPPHSPLAAMAPVEQEETLVNLAIAIQKRLGTGGF